MGRVRPQKWKQTSTRPPTRPAPKPSPGTGARRNRLVRPDLSTSCPSPPRDRHVRRPDGPARYERDMHQPPRHLETTRMASRSPQRPVLRAADPTSHAPLPKYPASTRPGRPSTPPARYDREQPPPRSLAARMISRSPQRPGHSQELTSYPTPPTYRTATSARYDREPSPPRSLTARTLSGSPPRRPPLQPARYERDALPPQRRARTRSRSPQRLGRAHELAPPPTAPRYRDEARRAYGPSTPPRYGIDLPPPRSHTAQEMNRSPRRPEPVQHLASGQKLSWSRDQRRLEKRLANDARYDRDLPPPRSRTAREISSRSPRRPGRSQASTASGGESPGRRSDYRHTSAASYDRESSEHSAQVFSRSPQRPERGRVDAEGGEEWSGQGLWRGPELGDDLARSGGHYPTRAGYDQDIVSDDVDAYYHHLYDVERPDSAMEWSASKENAESSPTDGNVIANSSILTPPSTPPGFSQPSPTSSTASETAVLDLLSEDNHPHHAALATSSFHNNDASSPTMTSSADTRSAQSASGSARSINGFNRRTSREFCQGKILPIIRLSFESKFPGKTFDAERAGALLTDERCDFFMRKALEVQEQLQAVSEGRPPVPTPVDAQEQAKEKRGVKRGVEEMYADDGTKEERNGGARAKPPPKAPRAMRSHSPDRSAPSRLSANANAHASSGSAPMSVHSSSTPSSSSPSRSRSMETAPSSVELLASARSNTSALPSAIRQSPWSSYESAPTPSGFDEFSAPTPGEYAAPTPGGYSAPTPGPYSTPTPSSDDHSSAPTPSAPSWAGFENTPWYNSAVVVPTPSPDTEDTPPVAHSPRPMDVDTSQPETTNASASTAAPPKPKPPIPIASLIDAPLKPMGSALASIDAPHGIWLAVRGGSRAGVHALEFDVNLPQNTDPLAFRVLALPMSDFSDLHSDLTGISNIDTARSALAALVEEAEGSGADKCNWPCRLVIDLNREMGHRAWTMRDFKNGHPLDISPAVRSGRNALRLVQLGDLSAWAFLLCTAPSPLLASYSSSSSSALSHEREKEEKGAPSSAAASTAAPSLKRELETISRTVITGEMMRACWPSVAWPQNSL